MDLIILSLPLFLLAEANSQQTFKRDALIKLYCDSANFIVIQNVTSDCDKDYLYLSRQCNARMNCEQKLSQNDPSRTTNATIKVKSSCVPGAAFSTGLEPSLTGTVNLITSPNFPGMFIVKSNFTSSVSQKMTGDVIVTGFGYFRESNVSRCNNNLLSLELISNEDKLILCLNKNDKERSMLFHYRVKSTPWKVKLSAGGQKSQKIKGFYFIFQVTKRLTSLPNPLKQNYTADSTEKESINPSISTRENTVKASDDTNPISLHPEDTMSIWQNEENKGVTLDEMNLTLMGLLLGGAVFVVILVLVSFIGCTFYWTQKKLATLALRSASTHALNTLNAAGDLPHQGSTLRVANGSNAVMLGAHNTYSYDSHNCMENCCAEVLGTQQPSPQVHMAVLNRAVSKDSVYSTTPSGFDSFDDCGEMDSEDDQPVIYSEPYGIVKGFNVTDIQ